MAYVLERSPGIFLLTVHVKGFAVLHLEAESGTSFTRQTASSNVHMLLEYSQTSGVARTLVLGGAKYHQMLASAFANHLLGACVEAHHIRPLMLDLSVLRQGFDVPRAIHDGFSAVQVKSITVMNPNTRLKIECTALASSDHRCVTDLLRQELPNGDPLARGWLINAAQINLYYPPVLGKGSSKVVTVEVTRCGRLNLHKFDIKLQAQLESYLVSLGILRKGQTLQAHVNALQNSRLPMFQG